LLLEQSTTLDPRFMAAYEFGAVVLPAVDEEAAIRLVEKGIRENPRAWLLYHHLGYIRWKRGEFHEASEAYMAGSRVEGAPAWMRVMAAQMETQGGSRETARAIYARMLEEADDEKVKELAALRLAQVNSLDEREHIGQLLTRLRERTGRCPQSWREVSNVLRAAGFRLDETGAPLDPADVPYILDSAACEAKLSGRSPIPQK
jgi:tetratricopeptide (TPR) repeat protein